MAAGTIITVLANIPWGQVVENAPKVADGAMKLWKAATRRKKQDASQDEYADVAADANLSEEELLKARLRRLEDNIRSLEEQMQASSELIKALAEQNTQLVQRIELNRVRLVRFAVVAALGGVVLLAMLIYVLMR
jgi:chromosome segregation ATPase